MYFDRTDIDCNTLGLKANCANGWQAVDATPQEQSVGGASIGTDPTADGDGNAAKLHYQMGPAPIKLVKANAHPVCTAASAAVYGCFDAEFVISEVNADVNLWLKDDSFPGGWKLHGQ